MTSSIEHLKQVESNEKGQAAHKSTPRLDDAWVCNTISGAFDTVGLGSVRAVHAADRNLAGEPKLRFTLPGGINPDTIVDEREVIIFGKASHAEVFKSILTNVKRRRQRFEEQAKEKSEDPNYRLFGEVTEQNIEFTVAAYKLVISGESLVNAILTISSEDYNNYVEAGESDRDARLRVANSSSFAMHSLMDK